MTKLKIPKVLPVLSLMLIEIVLFISCTEFFSTSLAPWAARDPDNLIPAVTVGNVNELIAMSENNPAMSLSVLKKIDTAVKSASGNDKAILQSAALEAAVNAAGVGSAVLNTMADGVPTNLDEDETKNLMVGAINDMKNLEASCSTLVSILPDPADTGAFDAFVAKSGPDELAMAAAMLLAGEAKKQADLDDYIDSTFDASAPSTDAEELAVKLAEAAVAKYDAGESDSPLRKLLDGLRLTTP